MFLAESLRSVRCHSPIVGCNLSLEARLAWLMEIPATVAFGIFYLTGPLRFDAIKPLVACQAVIWLGCTSWEREVGFSNVCSIRQVPGKRSSLATSRCSWLE